MLLKEFRGSDARKYIEQMGKLRIDVFHEYPYLYAGNLAYERKYLETYFSCSDSFVILCFDGDAIVGAATAIPMKYEEESFRRPFEARGYDTDAIVYYGESVLLPQYRGLGLGQKFMDARERYARSIPGTRHTCFCAVVREKNHPLQPTGYRSLEEFWKKNGYAKVTGLTTQYSWKEIGEQQESPKEMQFWMKQL